MSLTHISAAVEVIVANAAKTSATAQAGHEQAAAFHEALATAIQAKDHIAKCDAESAENPNDRGWKDLRLMWSDRYTQSINDASKAAQNMPALWLINLAPELAKVIGEA